MWGETMTREEIKELVDNELVKAETKFGPMNSAHEGYAVTLEEVQEAAEIMEFISGKMNVVWDYTRRNRPELQEMYMRDVYTNGLDLIKEAIQLTAMAKRFLKDVSKAAL
jgi:hypothetical protein